MGISTGVLKIIAQIFNVFYMIAGFVAIGLGIYVQVDPEYLNQINLKPNTSAELEAMQNIGPALIAVGALFVSFIIFGIHAIANNKSTSTKVYAIIHMFFIVLDFVARDFNLLKIIIQITLIAVCIMLSQRFRVKKVGYYTNII